MSDKLNLRSIDVAVKGFAIDTVDDEETPNITSL